MPLCAIASSRSRMLERLRLQGRLPRRLLTDDECLNQNIFVSLANSRHLIEAWRQEHTHNRPHSALGWQSPETYRATHQPLNLTGTTTLSLVSRRGEGHALLLFILGINAKQIQKIRDSFFFHVRPQLIFAIIRISYYPFRMIRSFKDSMAESLFFGFREKGFPPELQRTAMRKLKILHNAVTLQDLRVPPGNRLEALKGDREGQHSIRINDQWRICFVWRDGNAESIEIVDYH